MVSNIPVSVVLTRWSHASRDTPVLLLSCQGRIVLGHLQDIVDDVLLVHGTGQRHRPRLAEELRLSILQVVQDVVQLRRLECTEIRRGNWHFVTNYCSQKHTHSYMFVEHAQLPQTKLECKHNKACSVALVSNTAVTCDDTDHFPLIHFDLFSDFMRSYVNLLYQYGH